MEGTGSQHLTEDRRYLNRPLQTRQTDGTTLLGSSESRGYPVYFIPGPDRERFSDPMLVEDFR